MKQMPGMMKGAKKGRFKLPFNIYIIMKDLQEVKQ